MESRTMASAGTSRVFSVQELQLSERGVYRQLDVNVPCVVCYSALTIVGYPAHAHFHRYIHPIIQAFLFIPLK